MSEFYYVIVDLENLTYMQNGNPCKIKEADKFETYEDAKKNLIYMIKIVIVQYIE